MDIALRGSGSLHFLPLGSYSNFNIQSSWPGPSFDGNTLPAERKISDSGFLATWKFNAANLPFTSVRWDEGINTKNLAFGVSLVQPADQYVKSMRSAKYAVLIIGLTFALFFIFELMQKKPVHPVQYVLVGIALVIFYTLLVSISEIILFDYAYTIAAVATIILIALYAKSHFNTWRSAIIFTLLLAGLYGFIYVLISLEDTALLVGSIALFIVVAVIMYVTRKINWYQPGSQPVIKFQP
jgi:inner membrane protein